MSIDEIEAVREDQKENVVQIDDFRAALVTSLQNSLMELQKSAQVDLQRDVSQQMDDDVAEDASSPQEQFVDALLTLVNDTPDIDPAGAELVEQLLQVGQSQPQDAGAQARVDMERTSEAQQQGTNDQTMNETRVQEFALNEQQTRQAIEMFAKNGEETPAEVRQTATNLAEELPRQLADIREQLKDASPEETATLRQQRADLAQQVEYYEAFVEVLDRVAPAPDQNTLTEADMNARAEAVRNEPRYAGSPGAAGEISESRTGDRYNEFNAAEIGLNLRTDYDPNLGYARSVEWDVGAQIGNFGTRGNYFSRDEALVDIRAEQAVHDDYTNTTAERGHAAGQQFSGGDPDIARELMKMSNVWVMLGREADGVNQGAYNDVEDRIVRMRAENPDDSIKVRVEAVFDGEPQYLENPRGRELVVPDRFEFTITRTPEHGGEPVVERVNVVNREEDRDER